MCKCEFLPTQHAVDSDASRDDWASRVCAGAVCRVDRKRDKLDRQILDSQERAFWDVHRPAVSSFLVGPTPFRRSLASSAVRPFVT